MSIIFKFQNYSSCGLISRVSSNHARGKYASKLVIARVTLLLPLDLARFQVPRIVERLLYFAGPSAIVQLISIICSSKSELVPPTLDLISSKTIPIFVSRDGHADPSKNAAKRV